MIHKLIVIVATLMFGGLTHAADPSLEKPQKYAVLSLVGDSLNVVTAETSIGSNLDRNQREKFPVSGKIFDNETLLAVDQALKRVHSKTETVLLSTSLPGMYARQWEMFSGDRLVLPEQIASAIKKSGASHLVLLTKSKGEANLQFDGIKTGRGKLEGIGYYVDRETMTRRNDTLVEGKGFLAAYMYATMSLVDVATFTVVAQQAIEASRTYSSAQSENSFHPWDALDSGQKMEVLKKLVGAEAGRFSVLLLNRVEKALP